MPQISLQNRISPNARDSWEAGKDTAITGPESLPATAGEAFTAFRQEQVREGNLSSAARAVQPYIDERNTLINETTGFSRDVLESQRFADPDTLRRINRYIDSGEIVRDQNGRIQASTPVARMWLQDNASLVFSEYAKRDTLAAAPDRYLTDEKIRERVAADLAGLREQTDATIARTATAGGIAAGFAGSAVGFLQDPTQAVTAFAGGAPSVGRGVLGNALRAFLDEAAIAMGLEIPVQAQTFRFKRSIGSPYTLKEAAFNVLAASVGAGVIRAGGSITVDVAQQALGAYRARVDAGKVVPTDESEAAAEILERYAEAADEVPGRDPAAPPAPERLADHFEAVEKAAADLNAGRPVSVAAASDDAAVRAVGQAVVPLETIELAYARMIPDAANYLTRGERKAIVSRLRDAEFKLAELRKQQPTFTETYRAILRDLPPGKSKKAREGEAMRLATRQLEGETETLRAQVEALRGQMRLHDEANQSRKVLEQIDAKRKAGESEEQIQQWMVEQGHIRTATVEVESASRKQPDVDRGTPDAKSKKDVQMRERADKWAELLPDVSREVHETLAKDASLDPGAANEGQRAKLREAVHAAGEDPAAAVQAVRESGLANAPRGLQSPAGRDVAVPAVSSRAASERGAATIGRAATPQENAVLPDLDVDGVLQQADDLLAAKDVEIPAEVRMVDGEQVVEMTSARAELSRLDRALAALDAIDTCRRG